MGRTRRQNLATLANNAASAVRNSELRKKWQARFNAIGERRRFHRQQPEEGSGAVQTNALPQPRKLVAVDPEAARRFRGGKRRHSSSSASPGSKVSPALKKKKSLLRKAKANLILATDVAKAIIKNPPSLNASLHMGPYTARLDFSPTVAAGSNKLAPEQIQRAAQNNMLGAEYDRACVVNERGVFIPFSCIAPAPVPDIPARPQEAAMAVEATTPDRDDKDIPSTSSAAAEAVDDCSGEREAKTFAAEAGRKRRVIRLKTPHVKAAQAPPLPPPSPISVTPRLLRLTKMPNMADRFARQHGGRHWKHAGDSPRPKPHIAIYQNMLGELQKKIGEAQEEAAAAASKTALEE
ncbi:unnamed protein product [Oikopleura dioica]|uniref:Uncharacterized protein n=1 Tax=Oikopleura dioica TaxID=34765 RepID=E4XMF9_OIKDI|nr:unnamed protein product [Oikopleura dioica]